MRKFEKNHIYSKDKEEIKAPSKFKNKIDVCIFSNERNKEKGIRLLSLFWKQGIKALADFRNKKLRGNVFYALFSRYL